MIAVALLALALYVPGLLYPQSDASHAVFRVAVCLAAVGGIAIPRGRLVRWGLGLWAAGILASVLMAPDPWRAVWSTANRNEGAWQVGHYLLLTLVACGTSRERLVRWLAIAAVVTTVAAVTPVGWVNGRLAGSAGNPLYLAPLLLMGGWAAWRAGQAARLLPDGSTSFQTLGWWALLPVLGLAAVATGSKGVGVALVAAAGVGLLAEAPLAAIPAAIALAGLVWVVPIADSALIRLELGRVALHGIAANPLGWGAEGFSRVFDAFWSGVSPTGENWHDRAHCLVLDRALEWGVVGVVGWIVVVVAAWRRAELPERMAIAAYLGYSLTMFEMMWGAAGFAVLLAYILRGESKRVPVLPWVAAAVALVIGAAQLAQSQAARVARTQTEMARAIEMWSPVGGDLVEIFLKGPQSEQSLRWAAAHTELHAPHAAQQAFLLALWDRRFCMDLRMVAPRRPDVAQLCL